MKKSVDVISLDKWSVGYHEGSDSAILSFEFEDVEEPFALSMSREVAEEIAKALKKISKIKPKPDS